MAAAVVISGCTAAMPPGEVDTRLPVSPAPSLTTIDRMTALPEAVECATEHLDGRRSSLPGQELLPPGYPGAVAVRLVVPGRDAADARCHPTLVNRFSCRDTTTWAVPDPTEFLLAFGANRVRVVEGTSTARTQSTGDGRAPAAPKRSFTYAEYTLAAGDPRGAVAFERRVFGTCALATVSTVGTVALCTASVGTETGLVDVAFLATGDRLAQVSLSGTRWSADERDRAWQAVALYLRQQG
ncbi:hypothetical protein [Intrasporangium flavum]|uniref:hypothetical protein n=1 Tax=Intrasporangium flavum TaxID=1428657 RepID=UPI001A962386|nr:hypothetical protein [Intrasporangium flavum]